MLEKVGTIWVFKRMTPLDHIESKHFHSRRLRHLCTYCEQQSVSVSAICDLVSLPCGICCADVAGDLSGGTLSILLADVAHLRNSAMQR